MDIVQYKFRNCLIELSLFTNGLEIVSNTEQAPPTLQPHEIDLNRLCRSCGGSMKSIVREDENWPGPGAEKGLRFTCSDCEETVWIGDRITIYATLFSGIGAFGVVAYALLNDAPDFIMGAFSESPTFASISIGAGLLLFLVVFLIGGVLLVTNGIRMTHNCAAYPLQSKDVSSSQIWRILILGLLPWLLAVGFGMLNYTYFNLGDEILLIVFPIVAAPIYLAPKFGVAWMSVFTSTAFWAVVTVGAFWLFG